MNLSKLALTRRSLIVSTCVGMLTFATFATATPVPKNLGNGLDKLVESNLALQNAAPDKLSEKQTFTSSKGLQFTTQEAAMLSDYSIADEQGRLLVRINPDGSASAKDTAAALAAAIPSLTVTAIDETYRGVGVMNAFVSIDDVAALGQMHGVTSVILELKPRHAAVKAAPITQLPPVAQPDATPGQILNKLGNAFDQGVTQHRVDQINKFYNAGAPVDYEGAGITIGFLSDSFNTRTAAPRANADVASFDLPGAATNPAGNTQPVVLLQDFPGGTDEGRGMVQIGYKMAPKARLGFATADLGEVGFANNIRALAGLDGFTFDPSIQQGFKADVICDDVGYFDEPFFQDGIIGNGIDDVTAAGVSYFSSAANDIGVNGYDSDLRWVSNGSGTTAATNTALTNTNINLTGVDPSLYAGGFHNFNPTTGQLDVAQLVNIASNANQPPTALEWNEPYDQNTQPNFVDPPVFTGNGTITTAQTTVTFNIPASLTQGTLYQLDANADTGSSVDVTVMLKDPNGNTFINQDNQVDETVRFFAPVTGTGYVLTIGRFSTTTGPFHVTLRATTGFPVALVKTDVNLLVFRADTGAFISSSSLTTNNFATNQPIELGFTLRPTGQTQVQFVIARANVPANGGATHVRYLMAGNGAGGIGPAEYFTYDTVTTGGHAMATGCNGAAAYPVFRPNLPESFTSPGPVTIYFDKMGNPLATPEVRLQPRVAAADAANSTWSAVGDSTSDQDSNGNFSGTSAAAPHCAGVAALVLSAHGGPGSVIPAKMRTILQQTAFQHDLDPSFATGIARATNGAKITFTAFSDNESNTGTGQNDNNSLSISYVGPSSLASITFNPQGTAATAGNVTGGNNGVTYNGAPTGNGSTATAVTYYENNFPGMVWAPATKAFAVGSGSTVPLSAINGGTGPTFTNLAPSPSTTQSWTMSLNFAAGAFTGGNILRFNVGRAVQHSSTTGNTATIGAGTTSAQFIGDLLGGGVFIPSGTVVNDGMTFSGTTTDGGTFSGVIRNRIGAGYSKLDGYGFLNAEAAVNAPLP